MDEFLIIFILKMVYSTIWKFSIVPFLFHLIVFVSHWKTWFQFRFLLKGTNFAETFLSPPQTSLYKKRENESGKVENLKFKMVSLLVHISYIFTYIFWHIFCYCNSLAVLVCLLLFNTCLLIVENRDGHTINRFWRKIWLENLGWDDDEKWRSDIIIYISQKDQFFKNIIYLIVISQPSMLFRTANFNSHFPKKKNRGGGLIWENTSFFKCHNDE